MALNYNPLTSADDNIGLNAGTTDQLSPFYFLRKAIVRARKLQFFMPLASVQNMPKNYGKTIKLYEYVPLLDDRNVNTQGIDPNGVVFDGVKYQVFFPDVSLPATNANKASAVAAINDNIDNAGVASVIASAGADGSWATGYATLTLTKKVVLFATQAKAAAVTAIVPGSYAVATNGNLYGSSRDAGRITGRIPTLTENGGRVNRVGFTRINREGSISSMGMFFTFTKESIDFDSDSELMEHLSTELMNGATQLTEAVLQIDLINAAGVALYAGAATNKSTISGESTLTAAQLSGVDMGDLIRLDQILTDNRTPLQTTVITGSRYIDTATVPEGRLMFVGNEVVPHLRAMRDLFGNPAFIPVQKYADAGKVLNGEIGTVYNFRVIQVPEMLSFAGAGAVVSSNGGYRATNGRYDVFPMLVIGDDAFSTIGFQTDGKTVKFNVMTKMPGMETAHAATDPYGRTGFSSIQWYYGFLTKRPERIGVIYTIAPL